jgi:catechol 2,3-dioxygenase-like lactoylglutathione lyase family enzyme
LLGKHRVIATIPVHDIENAVDFYENVLGMKVTEHNFAGLVLESGEGRIAIHESPTAGSGQATCAWWTVNDVEGMIKTLKAKGVTFDQNYDLPNATRKGDMYILSEKAQGAWFRDPDGNILGFGNF